MNPMQERCYFTYIMASRSRTLYIGVTGDLHKKIVLIESLNAAWIDLSREWYDCEPADYLRSLDRMNS